MIYNIAILKGISPHAFLSWDIKTRGLKRSKIAQEAKMKYASVCKIIRGECKLKISTSLKLERALGYEEGLLMALQTHYEIKTFRKANENTPDMSLLSEELFWDTNINDIDWQRNERAIIERIMLYGNKAERAEITRFYGKDEIAKFSEALK